MISLEKLPPQSQKTMSLTPFQKLPKNVGKLIIAKGVTKLPKVQ